MHRITTPAGVTVSFDRWGSGPPLVLVHGAFSDHVSNWELVRPLWEDRFTGYAVARRGRGETDAIRGHGLEDEGRETKATAWVSGSFWRLYTEGARSLPPKAVARLHDLCDTASGL